MRHWHFLSSQRRRWGRAGRRGRGSSALSHCRGTAPGVGHGHRRMGSAGRHGWLSRALSRFRRSVLGVGQVVGGRCFEGAARTASAACVRRRMLRWCSCRAWPRQGLRAMGGRRGRVTQRMLVEVRRCVRARARGVAREHGGAARSGGGARRVRALVAPWVRDVERCRERRPRSCSFRGTLAGARRGKRSHQAPWAPSWRAARAERAPTEGCAQLVLQRARRAG